MVTGMLTYRVLSALLSYPTPGLKDAATEAVRILCEERLLSAEHIERVCGFVGWLLKTPQLDAEAAYIDSFDRGRSTSLHLFEHIHGESRARGEAMHRLLLRYRAHGLELQAGELPDFLPLFLEFLSTRPAPEAAKHLAEVSDIAGLIGRRLGKRGAPHAAVLDAITSLAGSVAHNNEVLPAEDEERDDTPAALDAAWEEAPVIFNDVQPPADAGAATAVRRVQP
jgi:nitrate reductase delta subunit